MSNEMINLLPPERRRVLAREYLLRLSVVGLLFITALTLIAGALLIPTFVLLEKNIAAKHVRLTSVQSTLSASDEANLSARLSALSADADILKALGKTPSATALLRDFLAISRPGVTLSSIGYQPSVTTQVKSTTTKKPGSLSISGVATTRDALRTYQLALQNWSGATSVNLPVSAYAQDSNIAFTIGITLSL